MYEMPPVLRGNEQQQLRELRDYLVRMARDLDKTVETAAVQAAETHVRTGKNNSEALAQDFRSRYEKLRGLIIKTADVVQHNVDIITEELHEDYLALSDFGAYQEQINTTIEETARGFVEKYEYDAALLALDNQLGTIMAAQESIRGEIRRGLITDPETGETALGIAIAEELSFTGSEETHDGLTYYELTPGQTIGLYTSTGWQFWINGSKRGWFDSRDGMLHVANLAVESSLRLGGNWMITTSGGFGLRYVGG